MLMLIPLGLNRFMSVPEGSDINPFIPNTGQRKKCTKKKFVYIKFLVVNSFEINSTV